MKKKPSANRRLGLLLIVFLFSACSVSGQNPTASPVVPIRAFTPSEASTNNATLPIQSTPSVTPTEVSDVPPLSDDQIEPQVDQLAAGFLHDTRNAGLSVAIVLRNPATGRLEAGIFNYGVISDQTKQPVVSDTIYEIGSLTKLFTALLLAQDVIDGKVKLDDPIQPYLPTDVRAPIYKGIPITLVELATHRSGLPRDPSKRQGPDPFSAAYTQQDLYTWLNSYQLTRAPGVEYEYSNAGFGLLGNILSMLAGEDYDQLEQQNISKPLGLVDTSVALSNEQENRLAQGYAVPGTPAPYFPQSGGLVGAGDLHSTISDMTRFLIANMQPDSTPFASALRLTQRMQAKADGPGKAIGLGWQISNLGQPDEWLWKRGQTNGFTSYISFARDGCWGFVLLTDGPAVESLAPAFQKLLGETTN